MPNPNDDEMADATQSDEVAAEEDLFDALDAESEDDGGESAVPDAESEPARQVADDPEALLPR